MQILLGEKRGDGANLRRISGSEAAGFPPHVMRKKDQKRVMSLSLRDSTSFG